MLAAQKGKNEVHVFPYSTVEYANNIQKSQNIYLHCHRKNSKAPLKGHSTAGTIPKGGSKVLNRLNSFWMECPHKSFMNYVEQ